MVAIADVSHYVRRGTALDGEAVRRATSVYFPMQVLPMLPERLSNGICSLNPEVERLCMVADMRFDASGVRQWATYFGGSGFEDPTGIVVEGNGRFFVAGSTGSSDLPVLDPGGGAYYQPSPGAGGSDAFIARFAATDTLEWCTYYGGPTGDDEISGIAVRGSDLYVAGTTNSAAFPTLDPGGDAYFQPALDGFFDTFIARFTRKLWPS